MGAKVTWVRSPFALLGAQEGQAQSSICIAPSPGYLSAADHGLRVALVGEACLRGFKGRELLKLNPEV